LGVENALWILIKGLIVVYWLDWWQLLFSSHWSRRAFSYGICQCRSRDFMRLKEAVFGLGTGW